MFSKAIENVRIDPSPRMTYRKGDDVNENNRYLASSSSTEAGRLVVLVVLVNLLCGLSSTFRDGHDFCARTGRMVSGRTI